MKCLEASVLAETSWHNNNNQVIVNFLFLQVNLHSNEFRKVVLFIFSLFAVVNAKTIYGEELKCVQTTTRLNLSHISRNCAC